MVASHAARPDPSVPLVASAAAIGSGGVAVTGSVALSGGIIVRGVIKLVVMDEADGLTVAAQMALRRVIEVASASTRFCFVVNRIHKLTGAILSRCTRFRFGPLPPAAARARLSAVATAEGVVLRPGALEALEDIGNGDLRRAINALQAAALGATRTAPPPAKPHPLSPCLQLLPHVFPLAVPPHPPPLGQIDALPPRPPLGQINVALDPSTSGSLDVQDGLEKDDSGKGSEKDDSGKGESEKGDAGNNGAQMVPAVSKSGKSAVGSIEDGETAKGRVCMYGSVGAGELYACAGRASPAELAALAERLWDPAASLRTRVAAISSLLDAGHCMEDVLRGAFVQVLLRRGRLSATALSLLLAQLAAVERRLAAGASPVTQATAIAAAHLLAAPPTQPPHPASHT
jgi:hypothetical protein